MRKFIIAALVFLTMSSVSLAPIEHKDITVKYETYTDGNRVVLFKKDAIQQLDEETIRLLKDEPRVEIPREIHPEFKHKIGHLESGNNYSAINQYGYLGKYQFSRRTLRRLIKKGYLDLTKEEVRDFKNLPYVQERAMDALIRANLDTFRGWKLDRYVGKTVGGVKVTVEGMLAAAHLLGPYAVKHYLQNNGSMNTVVVNGVKVRKYDANGTSLKKYLGHFA